VRHETVRVWVDLLSSESVPIELEVPIVGPAGCPLTDEHLLALVQEALPEGKTSVERAESVRDQIENYIISQRGV